MSLSVKEILNIGQRQLEDKGIVDAKIDSRMIYCYMMGISNSQLFLEWQKILDDMRCDEYFRLMDKRCSGVPVQHITGKQEFMGFEFKVNEKVLIPRQDTETLVEDAINIIKNNKIREKTLLQKEKKNFDILDLCTGSGAIGLSLQKTCNNVKVICSDISGEALEVARENAEKLEVAKAVIFEKGNLFEPFKGKFKNKKFDLIISNPPYIKSDVIMSLQTEVKDHEPIQALDGGVDGLTLYRGIIADAADFLKKDGVLLLEIGYDQGEAVKKLLTDTEQFDNIECLKDLAGNDRVVVSVLADKKRKKAK